MKFPGLALLPPAQRVITLPALCLAALLAAVPAFARDVPPTELSPTERAAWWQSQCTKLGAEVSNIEALRDRYDFFDRTAERLSGSIKMPNGELMYERLRFLESETKRLRANDAAVRQINQEHLALYAQYTRRMDQLVASDEGLKPRRTLKELTDSLSGAWSKWKPRQARYPLARAERDRACEESNRAQAEAERAQAQAAPPLKSSRFRARTDWTIELTLGAPVAGVPVGVGVGGIGIVLQQFNDGMWSPGIRLALKSAGFGVGADFGIGGPGDWSNEFSVHPPMRAEDFRGLNGGITVYPALTTGKTLVGGQATLHFVLDPRSGSRVDVPISTGNGLGFTIAAQYGGVWN